MIAKPSDRAQEVDLVSLLDRLSAVAPDFCTRRSGHFILKDESRRTFFPIQDIRLGSADGRMFKQQFRLHQLPLRIEYPPQWDVVSVQSGEFQALCSEEAIALLLVLVACLEAMEGRSNG